MGKHIGKYALLDDLTTKNAGFSRWGFCKNAGHEYFIKEFLTPVYPVTQGPLSEEQFSRKRDVCASYQAEKSEFYEVLGKCRSGNNIIAVDFFRDGSRYYTVTDKVSAPKVSIAQISGYSREKKDVLIRSVLYSVAMLHDHGIVHSDIKPDNVLTVETINGYCTAKIIDFDAGFLVYKQPKDVQGDLVYLAPEAYQKISGEEIELTGKIDIFALGILFHQYWCGELPQISGEYTYIFEAVRNNAEVSLNDKLPTDIKSMIKEMLSSDPDVRPDARELLKRFEPKGSAEPIKVPLKKIDDTHIKDMLDEPISSPPNKEKAFHIPDDLD